MWEKNAGKGGGNDGAMQIDETFCTAWEYRLGHGCRLADHDAYRFSKHQGFFQTLFTVAN
jgi:hypothetical protein